MDVSRSGSLCLQGRVGGRFSSSGIRGEGVVSPGLGGMGSGVDLSVVGGVVGVGVDLDGW